MDERLASYTLTCGVQRLLLLPNLAPGTVPAWCLLRPQFCVLFGSVGQARTSAYKLCWLRACFVFDVVTMFWT